MLSFIAICILSVSGHIHSHSKSHSHDHHHEHGHKHSSHSHSSDVSKHHRHSHDHHNHNSHSHSSDNNTKQLPNQHEHEIRHKSTGEAYHECSDDHNKYIKGENMHEQQVPYDNHPYANAVKKTKAQVLQEWKDNVPSALKNTMDSMFESKKPRSLLTDAEADPIRITAYYDSTTNSLSNANKIYLKQTISAAINYYESFVQVIPVSGPLKFNPCNSWWSTGACANYQTSVTCQNAAVPNAHLDDVKIFNPNQAPYYEYTTVQGGTGVEDTDLILYVSFVATSTCSGSTLAHAGPCKYDQYGRPIAGNINICQNFFDSSGKWSKDVQVMLHEMSHITIMVSNLWDSFRDPSTGGTLDFYDDVYEDDANIGLGVIKSPEVKSVAQNHFGCTSNSLKGLPLYAYSSHWHTRWVPLESLVPSITGPIQYFSKYTLALLKDSGWYYIDYEYAQPYYFSENAGCGMYTQACINPTNDNARYDYCDALGTDQGCTTDYSSRAQCFVYTYGSVPAEFQWFSDPTKGGDYLSDYCPYRYPYDNWEKCVDSDGLTSRCALRTSSSGKTGTCLPHNCINGGVEITVNSQTITCLDADAGTTKTVTGADNIICPEVDRICRGSNTGALTCYNGHYSTVYGQCICSPGWKGPSCATADDTNYEDNTAVTATSRSPTAAPTNPPSTICVQGFNSLSTAYNGVWTLDTTTSTYNNYGVYAKNIGTNNRAADERRIWFNAYNRGYYVTKSLEGSANGAYCVCSGSDDFEISECDGNWDCTNGGAGVLGASSITSGSCSGQNTPAPVTPAPTTPSPTVSTTVYCTTTRSTRKTRNGITEFDAATDLLTYINTDIDTYLSTASNCVGDSSNMDYFYWYKYINKPAKNVYRLIIKLELCCHRTDVNAEFDMTTYVKPNNAYKRKGTGDAAALVGGAINLEDGIGTKEIVVFVIIGIVVLVCIVASIYIGKRVYNKRAEGTLAETELTHKGSKVKNTPTAVADKENDFPNTTR